MEAKTSGAVSGTTNGYSRLDVSVYGISRKYGFIGDVEPTKSLPGSIFREWEDLFTTVSDHIKRKTLREAVHELPSVEFSEKTLKNEGEWRRAYTMLCAFGQGYIWMNGEAGVVRTIPEKLTVPWCAASSHLGLKPVITYASTVLYNFGVRDPSLPWDSLDNLYTLYTYTGTKDESYFFLIHVLMEMVAAPAICAISDVYELMHDKNEEKIIENIQLVRSSIVKIQEVVGRMYDGCDPKTFFVTIRPFFAGTVGLDVFPDGIVYEGVDSKPRKYHGASAGQSTVIFALDAFLGVVLSGEEEKFVSVMTEYMPDPHKEFLLKQKAMPSFPDYCKGSGNLEMVASFNQAVDELVKFRNQHVVLVAHYIINQKSSSVNPSLDEKGTAGTHAMTFLKGVRDKTIAAKITVT